MYQMYISISIISVPPNKVNLHFRLSRLLSSIKDKVFGSMAANHADYLLAVSDLQTVRGDGRGEGGGGEEEGGLAARRTHCQKQGKQGRYLQNSHVTPPPLWRHTSSLSYTQYTYTLCTVSLSAATTATTTTTTSPAALTNQPHRQPHPLPPPPPPPP